MSAWLRQWKLLVSHLQKASSTRITSGLMICQADCRSLVVKPSGPGALSGGKLRIMFQTSSVNLSPSSLSCNRGRPSSSKVMELQRTAGVPKNPSKIWNATSALSSSEVRTRPSCTRLWMWFLRRRPLAWEWKNLVGTSPSISQSSLDSYLATVRCKEESPRVLSLSCYLRASSCGAKGRLSEAISRR
jgi:hypothetical protein